MFNKYFLSIYFVILICAFVYIFKLSMPSIQGDRLLDKSEDLLYARVNRLVSLMTQSDKEDLSRLPCKLKNKNRCADTNRIINKINNVILGGAVTEAYFVNEKGENLFDDSSLDVAYIPLVEKAANDKISQILEKDASKKEDLRTFISLGQYFTENEFKDLYLVTKLDKSQIRVNTYPYYFLILTLFLLPLFMLMLQILRTARLNEDGKDEYESQISIMEKKIERLKQENVQQSQFLANFTHELRTPLNSVIGFSGLIKDETMGPLGNTEYKKYANDINNSGLHLLSLINDILDYSKAEVGRLKVNMTECDVVKVIKQCFSIVAPRANESGVELLQSFAHEHCVLKVDQKRFKQIILNLLSNSVKFTPEDGNITVSIFNDIKQDRLYIEVKDTGVGIDEKDIPTVMALFGQVETDLNRNYEGTGIGLPFAKKLTNLMGGTFEIQSKKGMGTRITLGFAWDQRLNAEFQENFR